MSTELDFPVPTAGAAFANRPRAYTHAAHGLNTRRAYGRVMLTCTAWCKARGACILLVPPAVVLAYLIGNATTLRVTTLQFRLASIRAAYEATGLLLDMAPSVFLNAWRGLKREHGL